MNRLANIVCSELKIQDVMQFYEIQFNQRGYANCPFHNDKTPSLKTHGNRYKCFGCGASGGVIDFVMEKFGINFQQAMIRLDCDFNLGLSWKKPTRRERMQKAENRRIEAAHHAWQASMQEDYKTLCTVHSILYRRSLNGEDWLNMYIKMLSELLDTFNVEEARKWRTIWK
jgi:DNA primase